MDKNNMLVWRTSLKGSTDYKDFKDSGGWKATFGSNHNNPINPWTKETACAAHKSKRSTD